MLSSLVYLQQENAKKSKKLMKVVNIEEVFITSEGMFQENEN